jgi:hypothetical protein
MAARSELRKEAYKFILQILGSLPESSDNSDWSQSIPLEELRLLKEGLEDPSPALVAMLKQMLKGAARDSALNAYLITPFKNNPPDEKKL